MEGYNINEIEVIDKDKPSLEELLTGDVIKGLDAHSPITPNSELEIGEYLQFPDGTTQRVVGRKHEKGGVKMNIPDGTKVVSDSLQPTKEQAKMLSEKYKIDVTTKDNFADIIDKYTKKIGLTKLNDEQEIQFKELKKVLDSKTDQKTLEINRAYLSKKINDLEKQKETKEKDRATFFNTVFDIQEKNKPEEEQSSSEEGFKRGGIAQKNFEAVCKKHGITPEQGMKMLKFGGDYRKFDVGGEFDALVDKINKKQISREEAEVALDKFSSTDIERDKLDELEVLLGDLPVKITGTKGKYRVSPKKNEYSDAQRVSQKAVDKGAYGIISDKQKAIQNIYNNFPDLVKKEFGNDIEVKNGIITFKKDLPLNVENKKILNLQIAMDKRMRSSAQDIINDNSGLFDEDQKKEAQRYLSSETFLQDKKSAKTDAEKIRLYDQKLGNFTSGRYSLGLDLVTKEDKKILDEAGISTISQLKDNESIYNKLSEPSQKRLDEISKIKGEDSDFFIDTFDTTPDTPDATAETTPEKETPETTPKTGDIKDLTKLPRKEYAKLFAMPDQSVLPPSPMEAHLKTETRLGRIDPIRLGIESQLQEIGTQQQFAAQQSEDLPPALRASMLSNILASGQRSANEAILNTNIMNAQNQSQAELFNAQQAGQESLYNANNALSFEQRQLTAKAKTEEELRNYYDFNRAVRLQNYQDQQKMNLLDSLYPEFEIDQSGAMINFDTNSDFTVEKRDNVLNFLQGRG
jgi:hypothetical protein